MKKPTIKPLLYFYFLPSLVLTFLFVEIVSYSNNILMRHPNLAFGKLLESDSLMGANIARRTRNTLFQNRLNLAAWHGYGEVLINRIFEPRTVRCKFRLPKDGYLSFIFNRGQDSFSAVRFSNAKNFPSACLKVEQKGKFEKKVLLDSISLKEGWNLVDVDFKPEGAFFLLNGNPVGQCGETRLRQQVIGFRSGFLGATVDNVSIRDSQDRELKENFSNRRGYWGLFLKFFSIIVLLELLLWGVKSSEPWISHARSLLYNFLLACILVSYFCFDYVQWSKQYPFDGFIPWQFRASLQQKVFEKYRGRFFKLFQEGPYADTSEISNFLNYRHDIAPVYSDLQIIVGNKTPFRVHYLRDNAEAVKSYADFLRKSNHWVVLHLGGSQMRGEGAGKVEDRLAYQIHARIKPPRGKTMVSVNAAQSGAPLVDLESRFSTFLVQLKPSVLVVNSSNNDGTAHDRFNKNLQSLIEICKQNKIRLVFVQESNTSETNNPDLLKNHEVMARLAHKNKIICVPLQSVMSSPDIYDSGFLWWDTVHMTPYGQSVAAAIIAAQIM